MEMIIIICALATVALLCKFAVMAIRRNWLKAFLSLQGAAILFLLIIVAVRLMAEGHQRARMCYQTSVIEDLKKQIVELKEQSSNQAAHDTARKLADPGR